MKKLLRILWIIVWGSLCYGQTNSYTVKLTDRGQSMSFTPVGDTFTIYLPKVTNTPGPWTLELACKTGSFDCVIYPFPGTDINNGATTFTVVAGTKVTISIVGIDFVVKNTGVVDDGRTLNTPVGRSFPAAGGGGTGSGISYCADVGSTDTYACSPSPAISSYAAGTHYSFKANTANVGAATINLNSLGAKTIKKAVGGVTTDLADNDIRVGQVVDVVYDGTNMQIQSGLGNAAFSVPILGTDQSTPSPDGTRTQLYPKNGSWCSQSTAGVENCIPGAGTYSQSVTAQTSVTITAGTHGITSTNIFGFATDGSGVINLPTVTVNQSTRDVTVAFGSSFTGKIVLIGSAALTQNSWTDNGTTVSTSRFAAIGSTLIGPGESINVLAKGATGNGTTDDTAAIQAAIDAVDSTQGGNVVFPPAASCYKSGNWLISGKSKLKLIGFGGRICWTGTGTGTNGYIGIELDGTVSDLVVMGLNMTGSGVAADYHAGVWVHSGATLFNIQLVNNKIAQTTLGLAVSNASSSTIDGFMIAGNDLTTIVGTASGQGYGIQAGTGNVNGRGMVRDNTINGAQRHSIYVSNGNGVIVSGNRIINHRIGQADPGSQLPAIEIARTQLVTVSDNIVVGGKDGCIEVAPGTGGTQAARDITISNNHCSGMTGLFADLTIGSTSPASSDPTSDIVVTGNHFYQTSTNRLAAEIYSGKRIRYAGNFHSMLSAPSGTTYFIDIFGAGESGASATYTDGLEFEGNQFIATGGTINPIGFRNAVTASVIAMRFAGNRGTFTASTFFYVPSTFTDPNVTLVDNPVTGLDTLASVSMNSSKVSIASPKFTDPYVVGTGGVVVNTLVGKDTSAPTKVITVSSGGCGLGVAQSTVSAAGTVSVQWGGIATLVADTGGVVAGNMIVGGTGTPGTGKDSLQTGRSGISTTTCVIGFAQTSAIAGATFTILLTGPGDFGTLSGAAGWGRTGTATSTTDTVTMGNSVFNPSGANLLSTDISTPSNPSAGLTLIYSKSGKICSLSPAGVENCTGAGGSGTVTSVGLVGTANQLTVTGASPITGSGSWTLSLPSVLTLPGTVNNITLTAPATAWTIQPLGDNQTTIIPGGTLLASGGALGTPSSGTLTNATGLPITGVTSSTSAQLRTLLSDESGTGAALFAGGAIGAATATSVNGLAITTTTGTLTLANGSTLGTSGANSITLTSTGTTTVTVPTSGTLATLAGTETFSGKTLTTPVVAILGPASDSTTAIKLTKADMSTPVLTVDTTNSRLGIGKTPTVALDIAGEIRASTIYSFSGDTTIQLIPASGNGGSAGNLWFKSSASIVLSLEAGGLKTSGTKTNCWATSTVDTSCDTSLFRSAAGIIGVGKGSTTANGSLALAGATFLDPTSTTGATSVLFQAGAGDASGAKLIKGVLNDGTTEKWSITRDGNLVTASNIQTGGLLQFAGTTSSFPAFKRSTTTMQARLADDSAYATLQAKDYLVDRHQQTTGTKPTISGCGTSPTNVGNDFFGRVAVGATGTGCVITFASAFTNSPACTVMSEGAIQFTYSTSTTALTIVAVGVLASTAIDYACTEPVQ